MCNALVAVVPVYAGCREVGKGERQLVASSENLDALLRLSPVGVRR